MPCWIVPATAGFAAALVTAPLWERRLRGPGWIDTPRPQRYAKRPVSRAGGAAWLTGFLAAMAAAVLASNGVLGDWGCLATGESSRSSDGWSSAPGLATLVSPGIVGLVAVLAFWLGRLDDRNRLRPGRKWMLQVALLTAGALALHWVPGSPGAFPGARSWSGSAALAGNLLLLAVVFSMAVVLQVALEILDHLDGLLAVHAMASAAALALAAAPGWARDAGLAACGASLGFLCWNRPPARLYLGNAGSLAVATVLPLLFIALLMRGPEGFVPDSELVQSVGRPAPVGSNDLGAVARWQVLAVLAAFAWPLLDLVVVTRVRLRRGDPPWKGGCDHLAHRLARRLGSDRASLAVGAMAAVAGFLLTLAGLR